MANQNITVAVEAIVRGLGEVRQLASALARIQNLANINFSSTSVGQANAAISQLNTTIQNAANNAGVALGRTTAAARTSTFAISGLRQAVFAAGFALNQFGAIGQIAGTVMLGLAGGVEGLVASLAILTAGAPVAGFAGLVKRGVEFNSAIETSRNGIAGILTSISEVRNAQGDVVKGAEAFNIALGIADELTQKISAKALETLSSTKFITQAFQIGLGPGLKAGLDPKQIVDITTQVAQAANALGVPQTQLNEEIRSTLTGIKGAQSIVARNLELSKELVDSWIKNGTYIDKMKEKLEGFALLAKSNQESVRGLANNTADSLEILAGKLTGGFTESLRASLKNLFSNIIDPDAIEKGIVRVNPKLQGLADFLQDRINFTGELIERLTAGFIATLDEISKFFEKYSVELKGIGNELTNLLFTTIDAIASILGDIFALIFDVFKVIGNIFTLGEDVNGNVDETKSGLNAVSSTLKVVSVVIGAIADVFRIIVGLVEAIVFGVGQLIGLLVQGVGNALRGIANFINSNRGVLSVMFMTNIGEIDTAALGAMAKFGERWEEVARQGTVRGLNRAASGLRFDSAAAAAVNYDYNAEGRKRPGQRKPGGSAGPRKNTEEDEAGGKKGKAASTKKDLKAELKSEIDALLGELSGLEATLARIKSATEVSLSAYKTDLQAGAITQFQYLELELKRAQEIAAQELEILNAREEIAKKRYRLESASATDQFKAGNISEAQYDQAQADADLKFRQEINKIDTERIQIKDKLVIKGYENAEATRAETEEISKQLRALQPLLEAERGNPGRSDKLKIDEQYSDQLKKLTLLRDTAKTPEDSIEYEKAVKLLTDYIGLLKLKADFNQAEIAYNREKKAYDDEIARVRDIMEEKGRSEIQIQEALKKITDERLPGLQELLDKMKQIAALSGDPSLVDKANEAQTALNKTNQRASTLGQTLNNILANGIQGFFALFADGFDNLGERMRKFFSDLLIQLAMAIIQALVLKYILGPLGLGGAGAGGGSGGGPGGFLAGLGGMAKGGLVPGSGGTDSKVGRLTPGEYVVTPDRVAQYGSGFFDAINTGQLTPDMAKVQGAANAGSNGQAIPGKKDTKVFALFGDDVVENYLGDSKSDEIFVAKVRRLKGALQSVLQT